MKIMVCNICGMDMDRDCITDPVIKYPNNEEITSFVLKFKINRKRINEAHVCLKCVKFEFNKFVDQELMKYENRFAKIEVEKIQVRKLPIPSNEVSELQKEMSNEEISESVS